jgi:penicillin-binding protein 1A
MANGRAKKILIVLVVLFVVGALASVGAVLGTFWWYGREVAELDEARLRNYRPPQVTRILARDGETVIGEIFTERRTFLRYEEIPSHVENAFLAAEDADFYKHEGMDYPGMVRALLANLRAGEIRQGGSTITQQVVKIFMLSPERTFERKVQELILSRRLEQAFTKREILELYLNEIYLGHGRYGIEEASWYYFGTSVRDLDIGQAAMLATLPKAPGRDSPVRNYDRARARQIYVLNQMVKHGFVSARDAQRHLEEGPKLADPHERLRVEPGAEEFVDVVRSKLEAHYGAEALRSLGARVVTTVDLPLQREARRAVIAGLAGVDRRNGYGHGIGPADPEAREAALREVTGPLQIGRSHPAVVGARPGGVVLPEDGFVARVGEHDVFVHVPEGSRHHDPDKSLSEQFPQGGIVEVRILASGDGDDGGVPADWFRAEVSGGPEGAVVVADVASGEIVAMVGGSGYALAQFNRAMEAKRQPGSSFKPFVYGAALETRELTAASIVSDSPEIYEKWRPTNFQRDKYRGDIRLRVALTHSVNTVAIKLADRIGIDKVIAFARAAGIESSLPQNLSLALGTGEVTPFELARAYLTLARGGNRIEPRFISEVTVAGRTDWVPDRSSAQTLSEDVVFILTSMMQSVVEHGTATKAKALKRPIAGKTGTSGDFHDAWFAGFTPRRVAVAWVGFDRPRRIGKGETGAKAALPIWIDVMRAAESGEPLSFTPPPSVSVRLVDAASGLLTPLGDETGQRKSLEEFFIAGTEPLDEAIPAALPAGDVLLDLYDDEATDPSFSSGTDGGGPAIDRDLADDVVDEDGLRDPDGSSDGLESSGEPREPDDEHVSPDDEARRLPSLDDDF